MPTVPHATELMVVGTIVNLPIGFFAFWLASHAARLRTERTWHAPPVLLLCAMVGCAWGLTSILGQAFHPALVGGDASLPDRLREAPHTVLMPAAFAALVAAIARNDVRALVAALVVPVYAFGAEGLLADPRFVSATPSARGSALALIAVAAGLCAAGTWLMTIESHVGRAAAATMPLWAAKLIVAAVLRVRDPDHSVLLAHEGLVTPGLTIGITAFVIGSGVVAVSEAVRLSRERARVGELRRSEERLRTLADVSRESILVHRDGVVIETNAQAKRLLGDDLLGRAVAAVLPGEERATADACSVGDDDRVDSVAVRLDGRRVPVEADTVDLGDGRCVTTLRDLTAARVAAARIRHLAERDGLTGLLNRHAFDAALAEAVGEATGEAMGEAGSEGGDPASDAALLLIDLDRFKPVNDAHGHAAGDTVLRTLAKRFGGVVRNGDRVGRIGGDEFAVLARIEPGRLDGAGAALEMAERIREAASAPVGYEGTSLCVGASVGVALLSQVSERSPDAAPPGDPEPRAEALRHAADLALYAAKGEGRDRVLVYDAAMGERANAQLERERDLRAALGNGEMELHYQKQQDLRSGATVGYEALMRWRHPRRGMVSPGEFIPVAEELGVIVALGRWALERACADFAALDDVTRVSVNVSAVQFERSDLVADVREALDASGLAPHRLELEVTESVLMCGTDGTLGVLSALRAMGIGLSLDDFGTGYASLSYLTRFPFSKIKIDRSFVDAMSSDARSHALVRSILAMASGLDMRVTAEGVETQGQLLHLCKDRCDEAQGYLLGKPMPMDEVRAARAAKASPHAGPEASEVA